MRDAARDSHAGVVLVPTSGDGSLAGFGRALQRLLDVPALPVEGCSGSFNHPWLSAYALRALVRDATAVRRLRRSGARLLHFTSHHLARYGPLTGLPYVVTAHDLIRWRDLRDRDRRPPLIHRPNARDAALLRLDAAGLRRADALVAVSHHTRRELIEQLGVAAERVHVVHEGVDRGAFRPRERRLLDRPYVLYVGSEHPRKNLATLFEAFRRARDELPGLALVKVGSPGGPEAPFRHLTLDHARAAGVAGELVVAERVSTDELAAWYSGAVCLVLPSLHEGFGLPPLEAMACGCPAVVSNAGALAEVVGDAGIVYGEPRDGAALAHVLIELGRRPELRAEHGRRGLRHAARFPWRRTAEGTRTVWRRVLDERTAPRTSPRRPLGQSGYAAASQSSR